jgi:hypothetical protein
MSRLTDLIHKSQAVAQHRPWPRAVVDADVVFAADELARAFGLSRLWASGTVLWRSAMGRRQKSPC